jgi:hypothetical protein
MQHHPSSASHVVTADGCLVSTTGLQYPTDYSSTGAVSAVVDPYTHHPASTADFPTSAMYVNSVWGPEQTPTHPSQSHVYYESYPGAAAAAMYGYPGHMLPGGQDAAFPGMQHQTLSESGKRKRRRVISYEQRKAANVRERKRMCHLNDAFDVLRKRVPTFAYEKKLSRIETLKLAVTYIQYMAELLDDVDDKSTSGSSTKSPGRSDGGDKSSSDASPTSSRVGTVKAEEYRLDESTSPSSSASSAD